MIVINNTTAEKILSQFFSINTALHQAHLTTSSFAEHKGYEFAYDAMLEFEDEIMERLFGYNPKERNQVNITTITLVSKANLPNAIEVLSKSIKAYSAGKYADLENIADSISGIASKLTYLLTLK